MGHTLFRKLGHGKEPIPGLLRSTKSHGGATVGRSGENALPRGGYVVGTESGTAQTVHTSPIPKTERHRMNKGERRLLARFADHRDFGTWISGNRIHLDPVMTTTRRREAMAVGRRNRQEAIYNVKTGESEPVR